MMLEWWASEICILASGLLPAPALALSSLSIYQSVNAVAFMLPLGASVAGATPRPERAVAARSPRDRRENAPRSHRDRTEIAPRSPRDRTVQRPARPSRHLPLSAGATRVGAALGRADHEGA